MHVDTAIAARSCASSTQLCFSFFFNLRDDACAARNVSKKIFASSACHDIVSAAP
jgi:hypothetical protein